MSADGHTPYPWHACAGDEPEVRGPSGSRYFPHLHVGAKDHERTYESGGRRYPAYSDSVVINSVTGGATTMDVHDANARLLALAPFAPHECSNRDCPGELVLDLLLGTVLGRGRSEMRALADRILAMRKKGIAS